MSKPLPNFSTLNIESILPFSKIRLVALDLDGTLLTSNDCNLPPKIIDFAKILNIPKHDVRLTIATGRTLAGARDLLEALPIRKDTPIVLYNGNVVVNKRYEVLARSTISTETLQKIVCLSSNFQVKVLAYSYDWLMNDEPAEFAVGWSSVDHPIFEYNKMPVAWRSWSEAIHGFTPSAIVIHTGGDEKIRMQLTKGLASMHDIYFTHGKTYIEVGPPTSNKGKALEYSAKLLGLSRDEVLAIGDNDNDAEMLAWAGIGVAVESASDLARENSDYITKRGVITGVIEVMRLIHSARRFFASRAYSSCL